MNDAMEIGCSPETVCLDEQQPIRQIRGTEEPPLMAPVTPGDNRNIHDIRIEGLNYGYLVKVGCQSAAIETKEKLVRWLDAYLINPDKVKAEWFKGVRPV